MKNNSSAFIRNMLIVLTLSFLTNTVIAQQPCNEAIMNTKGSWQKHSDDNVFPDQSFPKNQFPQVKLKGIKSKKANSAHIILSTSI
jgi:hypothetical protein